MKKLATLSLLLLVGTAHAANTPPPGGNGQSIFNRNGQYGALTASPADVAAAAAISNAIAAGKSFDPRDPAYGAICSSFNVFAGDGTTATFNYTIVSDPGSTPVYAQSLAAAETYADQVAAVKEQAWISAIGQ